MNADVVAREFARHTSPRMDSAVHATKADCTRLDTMDRHGDAAPAFGKMSTLPTNTLNVEDGYMQTFIRQTMLSILHPFAEHVRELQNHVSVLQEESVGVHSTSQQLKTVRIQYEADIEELRATEKQMHQQLGKAQEDIEQFMVDKANLDSDYEDTKALVRKAHASFTTASDQIAALQQGFLELSSKVTVNDQRLNSHGRSTEDHRQIMHEHRSTMDNMSQQHTKLVQEVGVLARNAAGLERSIRLVNQNIESQREGDEHTQREFGERQRQFDNRLCEADKSFRKMDETLKTTVTDLTFLRNALEADSGTSKKIQDMENRSLEAQRLLKEQNDQITRIEEQLALTKKQTYGEWSHWKAIVHKIEGHVTQNDSDLRASEQRHLKLKEQMARSNALTDDLIKEQNSLKTSRGQMHVELQDLVGWQREAVSKIDLNTIEVHRTQQDLANAAKDICTTAGKLHFLSGEVGFTVQSLSKLKASSEATTRELQAMTKGFQDTSRFCSLGGTACSRPRPPV